MKRILGDTATDLIPSSSVEEKDWHSSIIQSLNQLSAIAIAKKLRVFVIVNIELCYKVVAECLRESYACSRQMESCIESTSFGVARMTSISTVIAETWILLAWHGNDIAKIQKDFWQCQEPINMEESLSFQGARDWRKPNMNFRVHIPRVFLTLWRSKRNLKDSWSKRVSYFEKVSTRHL